MVSWQASVHGYALLERGNETRVERWRLLSRNVCTWEPLEHLCQLFREQELDHRGDWGKKHEMGHQPQAPVTVFNKSLAVCIFRADVPVTRSVTVSNEFRSPLHYIEWTDPPSLPYGFS